MFIQKIFIAIIKVFDNVKFSLLCHIIPIHYSLFAIRYSLFAICYSLFARVFSKSENSFLNNLHGQVPS